MTQLPTSYKYRLVSKNTTDYQYVERRLCEAGEQGYRLVDMPSDRWFVLEKVYNAP